MQVEKKSSDLQVRAHVRAHGGPSVAQEVEKKSSDMLVDADDERDLDVAQEVEKSPSDLFVHAEVHAHAHVRGPDVAKVELDYFTLPDGVAKERKARIRKDPGQPLCNGFCKVRGSQRMRWSASKQAKWRAMKGKVLSDFKAKAKLDPKPDLPERPSVVCLRAAVHSNEGVQVDPSEVSLRR
ncbi:unnamed protein product [Calypogeia fissa]